MYLHVACEIQTIDLCLKISRSSTKLQSLRFNVSSRVGTRTSDRNTQVSMVNYIVRTTTVLRGNNKYLGVFLICSLSLIVHDSVNKKNVKWLYGIRAPTWAFIQNGTQLHCQCLPAAITPCDKINRCCVVRNVGAHCEGRAISVNGALW